MKNILSDMKVDLAEMFDRNFTRKSFFGAPWAPRKNTKAKGSLLLVTGKMRRSIRPSVVGNGVQFSSALPYTELHNEGGTVKETVRSYSRTDKKTGKSHAVSAHTRTMVMPKRQFIGDHPDVQKAISDIVEDNVAKFFDDLAKNLR